MGSIDKDNDYINVAVALVQHRRPLLVRTIAANRYGAGLVKIRQLFNVPCTLIRLRQYGTTSVALSYGDQECRYVTPAPGVPNNQVQQIFPSENGIWGRYSAPIDLTDTNSDGHWDYQGAFLSMMKIWLCTDCC